MADEAMAGQAELHTSTEVPSHGAEHADPVAFGFIGPGAWVALAMTVFLGILLWKKVPTALAKGLDDQIASIRKQLDEAKALRAEADALRAEYAAKIAGVEKDAAAMLDHARHEADAIVAKAEADTATMISRREKMAQDKIAAAERAAVDDLRARAADAATAAARSLIAQNHGAKADKGLVDSAIAGIAKH
jgi:F-type H+-transporting ATPase subunit b